MSHIVRELTPRFVADYLAELERTGYPLVSLDRISARNSEGC